MMKVLKTHIKDAVFLDDATRLQAESDLERHQAGMAVGSNNGVEDDDESSQRGQEVTIR